jgi:hypothetical protein
MVDNHGFDGETLAQSEQRLRDDLDEPFERHANSRGRYGWLDILGGHAIVNVAVARCRESPREAGHVLAYCVIGLTFLLLLYVALFVTWLLS